MVIRNLYVPRRVVRLTEADAPLFVDLYAVLTGAAALQHFKPVARKGCKASKSLRAIQKAQSMRRLVGHGLLTSMT